MKVGRWLFSPGKIGNLELRNRLVVPAMVTNYGNQDGTVSEQLIAYHEARARGGFGLNISENLAVHPEGRAFPRVLGLWDDHFIPGLRRLAEAVHAAGGKIFAQIYHCGSQTVAVADGKRPVAPSALLHPAYGVLARELTAGEIWEIIELFGQAARRAREAGFDGVEVHGSHGYLVAQFLSPYTNKRTDDFGGDTAGRAKFPIEIIRAIRRHVGADYPVIIRMAGDERVPGGLTLEEARVLAHMLAEHGYDGLHITGSTTASMAYTVPCYYTPPALNAALAEQIKQCVKVPVITAGRINNILLAERILAAGRADFVAMGRASLADPDLPRKAASGHLEDIRPCIACLQGCVGRLYIGEPITCTVNPDLGKEAEVVRARQVQAAQGREVAVVGGGPAGLQAAITAARRGHRVTLYEKTSRLGGQLNIAVVPPYKQEISRLVRYLAAQVQKAGVRLVFSREATVDDIMAYDVVVIATGGTPAKPDVQGVDANHVYQAWDVLQGKVAVGKKIVVVGGGRVGCELAEFLAEQGKQVLIVEMREEIAADVSGRIKYFLLPRLRALGVRWLTAAKVIEILADGVKVERCGRTLALHGYDSVVLAVGTIPDSTLYEQYKSVRPTGEAYLIGDAAGPRDALAAIAEGWEVGYKI